MLEYMQEIVRDDARYDRISSVLGVAMFCAALSIIVVAGLS